MSTKFWEANAHYEINDAHDNYVSEGFLEGSISEVKKAAEGYLAKVDDGDSIINLFYPGHAYTYTFQKGVWRENMMW